MILETVSDLTCVRSLVHFKTIRNSILIKNVVQLAGIDSQTILITDIDRDGAVLAQASNILIDKSERRIRRPFCENAGLDRTVLYGKIKVERRVLGIR